jgi:hypothetical protein
MAMKMGGFNGLRPRRVLAVCAQQRVIKLPASRYSLAVSAMVLVVVALASPTAFAAQPPIEPLPYTSFSPANETTIEARGYYLPAGFEGITWWIKAIPGLEEVRGRISETPAVGIDGETLSDLDQVQEFSLSPFKSETNPMPELYESIRNFVGAVWDGWSTHPGTYYWQIKAIKTNTSKIVEVEGHPEFEKQRYLTPIFSITVVPHVEPPPLPKPAPTPAPTQTSSSTPPGNSYLEHSSRCHHGFVNARIGGKAKCLHSGAACSWRYRRQYLRYHYACVRKGHSYRLVRRH